MGDLEDRLAILQRVGALWLGAGHRVLLAVRAAAFDRSPENSPASAERAIGEFSA
ncbi:hypothetical protein GCM10010388_06480 [Streptomyces mauvecolor]